MRKICSRLKKEYKLKIGYMFVKSFSTFEFLFISVCEILSSNQVLHGTDFSMTR